VVLDRDGTERLYFVVETKPSMLFDEWRPTESAKVKCGRAHFDALAATGSDVRFEVADSFAKFRSIVAGGK